MKKYVDVETVRVIAHDYLRVKQDEGAFMSEIDGASVSDVAPIVHAQWIERHDFPIFVCSFCGNGTLRGHSAIRIYETYGVTENTKSPPYCPNCGARMDTEDKAFNHRVTPSVNAVRELIDVERQKVPQNPAIHPKSKAFASGVEHGMRMAFDVAEEICGKVEFTAGNNMR